MRKCRVILDPIDRRILAALQRDGRATHGEIAKVVPLSSSQVQRRIKRLEDEKVVTGYAAIVDPRQLGYRVMAFASVSLRNQHSDDARKFHAALARIGAVTECHVVSGSSDYLLRVVAADVESLSQVIRAEILSLPMVDRVNSQIVFETIKSTIAVPT